MGGEIEERTVGLAEARAGLRFKTGHPVTLIVEGLKGSRRYGAGKRDEDSASADAAAQALGYFLVQVLDHDSKPIAGAAYQLAGDRRLAGTTDAQGYVRHGSAPHGYYELAVAGREAVNVPTHSDGEDVFVVHLERR